MNLGPETERVEHKKSTSELKEGMQSIAAILNKHGAGELYFGVRDDGEIIGQQFGARTARDISQAITNSIEPRVYATIEQPRSDDGKDYVKVSFSGPDRPYSCKGTYRIRVADEDLPMTSAQLERQMLERLNRREPWDSRSSGRPVSDVDESALRRYVRKGNDSGRIPEPFTDVEGVLTRLGLIAEDGALTNAASELFCAHRSGYPRLKMGFLAGNTKADILDLKQESGPMLDLLDRAEAFAISNIRRRLVIGRKGMEREEIPEIPAEAIREAVANALCHRDYTVGAAVEVNVYMDTVQVVSPGLFPEGDSPELHLSGEAAALNLRNPKIADALFRAGVIEQYGSGIPRIKRACEEAGVAFEYADMPNFTALVFHRPGSQLEDTPTEVGESVRKVGAKCANGLSSTDRAVYDFVEDRQVVSNAEVAEHMAMSANGARKALQRLIDAGLVKRDGQGKATRYRLV